MMWHRENVVELETMETSSPVPRTVQAERTVVTNERQIDFCGQSFVPARSTLLWFTVLLELICSP